MRGMKFKYSRCSRLSFCARRGGDHTLFRRKKKTKVFVKSDGGYRDWRIGREKLDKSDPCEDEGGSTQGSAAKMFM